MTNVIEKFIKLKIYILEFAQHHMYLQPQNSSSLFLMLTIIMAVLIQCMRLLLYVVFKQSVERH
jgi:hypothetical protein